jgi:hypothetical protein
VPEAQQGIEQELEMEPESASQASEQILEFGAFKASIIYIVFILNDRLSLYEANFRYFYTK